MDPVAGSLQDVAHGERGPQRVRCGGHVLVEVERQILHHRRLHAVRPLIEEQPEARADHGLFDPPGDHANPKRGAKRTNPGRNRER